MILEATNNPVHGTWVSSKSDLSSPPTKYPNQLKREFFWGRDSSLLLWIVLFHILSLSTYGNLAILKPEEPGPN